MADIVNILMENDCDINALDNQKTTPLIKVDKIHKFQLRCISCKCLEEFTIFKCNQLVSREMTQWLTALAALPSKFDAYHSSGGLQLSAIPVPGNLMLSSGL